MRGPKTVPSRLTSKKRPAPLKAEIGRGLGVVVSAPRTAVTTPSPTSSVCVSVQTSLVPAVPPVSTSQKVNLSVWVPLTGRPLSAMRAEKLSVVGTAAAARPGTRSSSARIQLESCLCMVSIPLGSASVLGGDHLPGPSVGSGRRDRLANQHVHRLRPSGEPGGAGHGSDAAAARDPLLALPRNADGVGGAVG